MDHSVGSPDRLGAVGRGARQGARERLAGQLLHWGRIDDIEEIRRLVRRMATERVRIRRALNRRALPETAIVEQVRADDLILLTSNFENVDSDSWVLSATVEDSPYVFVVEVLERYKAGRARVELPKAILRAERRDRVRSLGGLGASPSRVRLTVASKEACEGKIRDLSPSGLGVLVASESAISTGAAASVLFLDGERAGTEQLGEIRSVVALHDEPGWQRVGVSLRAASTTGVFPVERWSSVVSESRFSRVATRMALAASALRSVPIGTVVRRRKDPSADEVHLVEYRNNEGEHIRAILDSFGDPAGAPVVVIPPAWGKTKETLLPLAATIIACFRDAGRAVSVLRYDGIRRRGESFNEPFCRAPGREHLRFSFSQGVRDIQASLDFVFGPGGINPSTAILVSFSAASIEARRAMAAERKGRLGGWISVVGAPDLQSAMKVVSGGIDFVGGFERGVRFGLQEIQGVLVDMDFAAQDVLDSRLGFMDDAMMDMARISKPITWIHGRFDAWMDLERVKTLMGAGSTDGRRLIEVPTGHQLRSSVEALEVFQLISSEVARLAGVGKVARAVPSPALLARKGKAERSRVRKQGFEARQFWRDYLIGRNGRLGIELMAATSAYRELMSKQVAALSLAPGDCVVDLGSGVGSLGSYLRASSVRPVRVLELDFVCEALRRSRTRYAGASTAGLTIEAVACDLARGGRRGRIPLADQSQDKALASLLISYLEDPGSFLREVRRILKPGGRLVLSTMRPDADTSRIYEEGSLELRSGRVGLDLPRASGGAPLEESLQSFLNDAARLLDLEEQSVFRFFDQKELEELLVASGFEVLGCLRAFGVPPQALVAWARKS